MEDDDHQNYEQNALLSSMEKIITTRLQVFEQSQKEFSQTQISRIQQSLGKTDTYTFRKKGNEEQSKVNDSVLGNLKEADCFLQETARSNSSEAVKSAQEKVSEGMDLLNHRQKLIKLADSSDSGWRVVQEYEAHPLAEDEEDEKKIYRAQLKADRKLKQERSSRGFRFSPFPRSFTTRDGASTSHNRVPPVVQGSNQLTQGRKLGTCFRCGRAGHWRADCRTVLNDVGAMTRDGKLVQPSSQISSSPCTLDATYHLNILGIMHSRAGALSPSLPASWPSLFYNTKEMTCVCAEGSGKQTFYLIDESQCTGDGAEGIVSMANHYLKFCGTGEEHAQIHLDRTKHKKCGYLVCSIENIDWTTWKHGIE